MNKNYEAEHGRKIVDSNTYIAVLRELVEQGEEVCLLLSGNSMLPFLVHDRDKICFQKASGSLKKGDMVFYQRANGQFVMHRICKVRAGSYDLIGDGQKEVERNVKREQIFAVITRVYRKGKWIDNGDPLWIFFERIWVRIIPLRGILLKLYRLFQSQKTASSISDG